MNKTTVLETQTTVCQTVIEKQQFKLNDYTLTMRNMCRLFSCFKMSFDLSLYFYL